MKEIISGITSPFSWGDNEPTNAANFSTTDMTIFLILASWLANWPIG
jgi:hypothetical protein